MCPVAASVDPTCNIVLPHPDKGPTESWIVPASMKMVQEYFADFAPRWASSASLGLYIADLGPSAGYRSCYLTPSRPLTGG